SRGAADARISKREISGLAIDRTFITDQSLASNFVDSQTMDGIVTLSGSVGDLLAKRRAVALAETIKGVKSVIDEIKVTPSPLTDEQINGNVTKAFAADPAVRHYAVTSTVREGVVTLNGQVAHWPEKRLAQEVAESVRGVRDVRNEIALAPRAKVTDGQLEADIARVWGEDAWLEGTALKVAVHQGQANLSGKIHSAAEKARAYNDALVAGAQSVDDTALQVDWAAGEIMERNVRPVTTSDLTANTAVVETLVDDPRVSAFQTRVTVNDGIVTLGGVVDNLKARKAAEEDARNTLGVLGVENFIKVRPVNPPSDSVLTNRVEEALMRNSLTAFEPIQVAAIHGTVYLSGMIDTPYMKETAIDSVYRVDGVTDVEDGLILRSKAGVASMSDWELQHQIENQIAFSPLLDARKMEVLVANGVVTLKGEVNTLAARQTAMDLARKSGARSVRNRLTVMSLPVAHRPEGAS
ncbi:MAG: BON domain-containing protein, partial [Chthoniobacter sp.]|uniref:BON domain-containing protein n=1 Tax=Chthoniobacter sp. TaxID=2510640 RepID=UPI0032AB9789